MTSEAIVVSVHLQEVARRIDEQLESIAGRRIGWSLFVWTEGRASYISSTDDRAEVKRALRSIIDGWDAGMPDVPAHEVKG